MTEDEVKDSTPGFRRFMQDMVARDQFALAYIQNYFPVLDSGTFAGAAERAYRFADAMMKARAK